MQENQPQKILSIPIRISVGVIIIGSHFLINHYPYGKLIILSGFGLLTVLYPFRFWYRSTKTQLDYIKVFFILFLGLSAIFQLQNFPYAKYTGFGSLLLFIAWLFMEKHDYTKSKLERETKGNTFSTHLLYISGGAFFIGHIMRVQHYAWGTEISTLGTLLIIIWIFKDLLLKKI